MIISKLVFLFDPFIQIIKKDNKFVILIVLFVMEAIHAPFEQIHIIKLIDPDKGGLIDLFGIPL